ncbi:uncharacterized protein FIBRA_03793 [Fibroporia radiculosa]|uniref:Tat pathway signal sequence n=1 Tax=Fibroporia radiculosa TaxID=599839 RepID=J4HW66_9APHY|nr:uncharacterized protein FIBRA_03793 [Fibroporia radiculosa]CCM01727.1 predicted protein [Fibroporia radiculosa]
MSLPYSPIAQGDPHESSEKLLAQPADIDDTGACPRPRHRPSVWRSSWLWLLHAFLLFLNLSVLLSLVLRSSFPERVDWDDLLNAHSPVYPAVEYNLVRFNGTIGFRSPYVGIGPSVDAAWAEVTDHSGSLPIRIPDDYLSRIRLDDSHRPSNVRFLPEDGGGSMGSIDLFHNLHCVNMFRKYSYLEDYPEIQDMMSTRPRFFRDHMDHCLEMLRQNLMCHADIALITYDWVADFPKPFPDFSTVHQCRDFTKIQEWERANRVRVSLERIQATRKGGPGELSVADVDLSGVLTIGSMGGDAPSRTD